jgi:hypothetical protein
MEGVDGPVLTTDLFGRRVMRMPVVSEPVLRRGSRHYRDVAWKQSPAVIISQEVTELMADEGDIVSEEGDYALEEDLELPLDFMEGELELLSATEEELMV